MWKVSLLKGDQEKHMASNKTYWKTIDQLDSSNEEIKKLEQNEFVSKLPEDFLSDEKTLEESNTSRRDFLKYVGFSTAAATLAACEGPVIKSVPYVVQPEQIRPGVANYYATTIANGFDFGSVLIKTREGRPIKVESNPEAPALGIANARFLIASFRAAPWAVVNTGFIPTVINPSTLPSKIPSIAASTSLAFP